MQRIIPGRPNTFTGGSLARLGERRTDDGWVAAARADTASRYVWFWRGQAVIARSEGAARAALLPQPEMETPWVFLGQQDGASIFAADVSAAEQPPGEFADLRIMAAELPADDATILATARGMLHWRSRNGFCANCGSRNVPVRGGYVLHCTGCGAEHFPRTDGAVIMLITDGDRALLGQSHNFPIATNMFSALAGFIEPGESLEDAVRREVQEEVGVRVGEVVYHSSQPWPFPASLMLGFYGEALSCEIVLDATEMRDARWATADEIRNREVLGFNIPNETSIARRLIDDWLASMP